MFFKRFNFKKINISLIIAIVFLVPLFFLPKLNFNVFTLPKISFLNIFLFILLFFYILHLLQKKEFIFLKPTHFLLALLTFFILISSLFFQLNNYDLTLFGSYNRQTGFFTYAGFFLFFFILTSFLSEWKDLRKIIFATIFCSFLVSLYGLAQYFSLDLLNWNENPEETGRIFSTLGQPNFLGHFLAINIPLTIFAFFKLAKRNLGKTLFFVIFATQFTALVLTLSRAAWLALLVGGFFAIFLYLLIKKKYKVLIISLFSVFLIVFIGGLFLINTQRGASISKERENLSDRIVNLTNFNQGSGKMRLNYWKASWTEFREADLKTKMIGHGPDNLKNVFARHYEKEWGVHETINTYPDRAHNIFFDTLLQFGLLGGLAFLVFFGYIAVNTFYYLRNGTKRANIEYWLVFTLTISWVIYFTNNLFSFSSVSNLVYFYLFIALISVIVFRRGSGSLKVYNFSISKISKTLILTSLAAFILIYVFFYGIRPLQADYYYRAALETDLNQGKNCPQVLDLLEKSKTYAPFTAHYKKEYLRYGLNCYHHFEKIGREDIIKENLLYELEKNEGYENRRDFKLYKARIYSVLSRSEKGYGLKAEKIYKNLINSNPHLLKPYKDLAMLYLQQKENKKAIKYLEKALDKAPSPNNKFLNLEHRKEVEGMIEPLKKILKQARL